MNEDEKARRENARRLIRDLGLRGALEQLGLHAEVVMDEIDDQGICWGSVFVGDRYS